MELPNSIQEINKTFKTTKVTTLDKALSFKLKRMFSGSLLVDELSGGGFAFRRRHMLFGAKSAGKNALLYQMIAYNQRICRNCQKIRQDWYDKEERHTMFLKNVLGMDKCTCNNSEGRRFLILDYEKSLSIEEGSIDIIKSIINKETGEIVDESIYDENEVLFNELSLKTDLSEEEKQEIKNLKKFFKNTSVETSTIKKDSTKDYLTKCGILINELHVCDPEDLEEGTDIIIPIIKAGDMEGIILDSIQSSLPRYVKERESSQATIGAEGKSNSLLYRHICSAFSSKDLTDEHESYKPAFFITSQIRSSLGSFIVKESYSGGHAIAHLSDFILELKRETFIKSDGSEAKFKDHMAGQKIRVRTEKSKLSAPGQMYEYDYFFSDANYCATGEIDHIGEIVTLGILKGIIERTGPYYKISTGDTFQGMSKLNEFCRNNPEFVGKIYHEIKSK